MVKNIKDVKHKLVENNTRDYMDDLCSRVYSGEEISDEEFLGYYKNLYEGVSKVEQVDVDWLNEGFPFKDVDNDYFVRVSFEDGSHAYGVLMADALYDWDERVEPFIKEI